MDVIAVVAIAIVIGVLALSYVGVCVALGVLKSLGGKDE